MIKTLKAVAYVITIVFTIILFIGLSIGVFLFFSEDVFGYTPHVYFTPYKK